MNVASITISGSNPTDAIQSWLDDHSTVTIKFVQIEGTMCFIFYD